MENPSEINFVFRNSKADKPKTRRDFTTSIVQRQNDFIEKNKNQLNKLPKELLECDKALDQWYKEYFSNLGIVYKNRPEIYIIDHLKTTDEEEISSVAVNNSILLNSSQSKNMLPDEINTYIQALWLAHEKYHMSAPIYFSIYHMKGKKIPAQFRGMELMNYPSALEEGMAMKKLVSVKPVIDGILSVAGRKYNEFITNYKKTHESIPKEIVWFDGLSQNNQPLFAPLPYIAAYTMVSVLAEGGSSIPPNIQKEFQQMFGLTSDQLKKLPPIKNFYRNIELARVQGISNSLRESVDNTYGRGAFKLIIQASPEEGFSVIDNLYKRRL